MVPGELIIKEGKIEYNKDKNAISIEVINTGDRPIQIGSHYHFYEVNEFLKFDREKSYGKRLDIPSGTAVRFEPGDKKEIYLINIGGSRMIYGLRNLVDGSLDERGKENEL